MLALVVLTGFEASTSSRGLSIYRVSRLFRLRVYGLGYLGALAFKCFRMSLCAGCCIWGLGSNASQVFGLSVEI